MDRYSAPSEFWRVISEIDYAKGRGDKQVSVDISDLQFLYDYTNTVDRFADETEELEDQLREKENEVRNLEDDLYEANEEITKLKETLRKVKDLNARFFERINDLEIV